MQQNAGLLPISAHAALGNAERLGNLITFESAVNNMTDSSRDGRGPDIRLEKHEQADK